MLISFQYPDNRHSILNLMSAQLSDRRPQLIKHTFRNSILHLSYEEWSVLAEKEDKTFPKEPKTLQSRIW